MFFIGLLDVRNLIATNCETLFEMFVRSYYLVFLYYEPEIENKGRRSIEC